MRIATGEWTTAYDDVGQGTPVVLVHGITVDRRMWDPQLPALQRAHRVIRLDLIGHGRSSKPQHYRPQDYAAQVLALIQALELGAVHLCGLSWGAAVSVRATLTSPHCVRSLTLANPYLFGLPFPPDSAFRTSPHRRFIKLARSGDLDAARREWAAMPFFARAQALPAARERLQTMLAEFQGAPWIDRQRSPEPDDWGRLEEIRVPTLVITSEHDDPAFALAAQHAARTIPRARLQTIPGCGHLSNLEAPRLFNELLLRHLAAADAEPAPERRP
jgi:pimeloyl-ACP methyl ester carboxylesterase